MGEVLPLPNRGEVFLDPRGEGRSLRVSWHRQESMLVLSLWQLGQCRATFRLPTDEVPDLVRALVAGLSDSLTQQRDAQQVSRAVEPPLPVEPRLPGAPPAGPTPPRWDRPPVVQPPTADAPPATEIAAPADAPPATETPVPAEPSADAVETPSTEPPTAELPTEQVKPSPAEAVRADPQVGIPRLIFLAPPDPA